MNYGYTNRGKLIVAPEGWMILPEGAQIPPVHRECSSTGHWMTPRNMSPLRCDVAGDKRQTVRAVAVPMIKGDTPA